MVKSVRSKVAIILILLFVPFVVNVVVLFQTLETLNDDGKAINLAGSQRMRTMLLGLYALEYAENTEDGQGTATKETEQLLRNELEQYEQIMNALVNGDPTYGIKSNGDPQIVQAILDLNERMGQYTAQIHEVLEDPASGAEKEIASHAVPLKNEINEVVLLYQANYDEKIETLKAIEGMILLTGALFLVLGIVLSGRLIVKPLNTLLGRMEDIAAGEGDLTARVDIHTNDEFQHLGNAFNEFVGKIHQMVDHMKKNVDVISASSSNIYEVIEEVNTGMNDIVAQVSAVSEVAQGNAGIAQEATASINELAENAEVAAKHTMDTATKSSEVQSHTLSGQASLEQVVSATNAVSRANAYATEVMVSLRDSSERISEVVTLIDAISEQTNLLALNASIEAARAGEHGKGFAVVAEEVRKLAEESQTSTQTIKASVNAIGIELNKVMSAIEDGNKKSIGSLERVRETESKFDQILSEVNGITSFSAKATEVSQKQSQISKQMITAIEQVSVYSVENANAVDAINQTIEEQVSAFEEITASLAELSDRTMGLKDLSDRFKV